MTSESLPEKCKAFMLSGDGNRLFERGSGARCFLCTCIPFLCGVCGAFLSAKSTKPVAEREHVSAAVESESLCYVRNGASASGHPWVILASHHS